MKETPKNILLQHVVIEWDKSYRGGSNAAKRNSVKEKYNLPENLIIEGNVEEVPVHMIRFSSSNEFEKPWFEKVLHEKVKSNIIKHGCVFIEIKEDCLDVVFEYDSQNCGAPSRYKYDPQSKKKLYLKEKAFTLNPDEFGKIIVNGRFSDSDTGNWWYEKQIFNIIYTYSPDKDIFKKIKVAKEYSQLAKMW